jgi:predicted transcriptional regulator
MENRRQRIKDSEFPHMVSVRISDRQYNDMQSIKKARNTSDTYIMREALQLYLNQTMYRIINPGKVQ